jgi:type IV pilus assembly protein PilV
MRISLIHNQQGVGLIEVLVAMLLLAIGVMGFAALQVRAIGATSESISRTQAMSVMRGLGERIRANSTVASTYPALITTASVAVPSVLCTGTTVCTPAQLAIYDAYLVSIDAASNGMRLSMSTCPNLLFTRQCMYAAWNKTTPTLGTNSAVDCVDSQGRYYQESSCLVLESY